MLIYITLLSLLFGTCSVNFLEADTKKSVAEEMQYNTQDRVRFTLQNPIKGLYTFNFFQMFPAKNKILTDKINTIIEKELNKFGIVKKKELVVKTDKGDAVDVSVFGEGVSLIYEIRNIISLDGKELNMIRASLNLSTVVNIQKTKEISRSYVWSSNCFMKGDTEKDLESHVSESLNYLLQKFMRDYSNVNSEKPVFNLIL